MGEENRSFKGLSNEEKVAFLDGLQFFRNHCGSCHGKNAGGGRAPGLTDGRRAYGDSDDEIFISISEGRSAGRMPQMKGRLKEERILNIISMLRTLEKRY